MATAAGARRRGWGTAGAVHTPVRVRGRARRRGRVLAGRDTPGRGPGARTDRCLRHIRTRCLKHVRTRELLSVRTRRRRSVRSGGLPRDLLGVRRRRQIPHPAAPSVTGVNPAARNRAADLALRLRHDEADAEDGHHQHPQNARPGEGDHVPAGPNGQDHTPDGDTEDRVQHPLLGVPTGQVEVDPGLEELQRVRNDRRQRLPIPRPRNCAQFCAAGRRSH